MATATVQSIVDRACNELGLPTNSLDPGLIDQIGQQSLALVNALGDDILRAHDWQFLEATATFVGDGSTSEFDMPADFGRIVNQTTWSTTNRMPMDGPLTAQQWGWCQFGIVSVGLIYRYRILGNKLAVFPTPGLGEEIKFYYIKKNWAIAANGTTPIDEVTSGAETPLFDRSLMIKGLKARLWAQKGFDTTALAQEFNDELSGYKAQDQGAPVLRLAGYWDPLLIDPRRNIPEGNW